MSGRRVAILLSIGRNPVSGRARPAERDARAIAIAMASGLEVVGVHAGPRHEALRDYLGMGLSRLVTVDLQSGQDAIPALSTLLGSMSDLTAILAGSRSETGDGTGLVPYAIADALLLPLLPAVTALDIEATISRVVQALPGGRRQAFTLSKAFVGTVDGQGPPLRQVARGPAARGLLETATAPLPNTAPALNPTVLETRPARRRPKRIRPGQEPSGGERRVLLSPSPRDAALEILRYLEAERVLATRNLDRPCTPEEPK